MFRRENYAEKGTSKKKALNVYSDFFKKSEFYKRTSEMTDKQERKHKRKGALFCSLSKQGNNRLNKKGTNIYKQSNPESR